MIKTKVVSAGYGTIEIPPNKALLEPYLTIGRHQEAKENRLTYQPTFNYGFKEVVNSRNVFSTLTATIKFLITTDGFVSVDEYVALDKEAVDMMNKHISDAGIKTIGIIAYPDPQVHLKEYRMASDWHKEKYQEPFQG